MENGLEREEWKQGEHLADYYGDLGRIKVV